MSNLQCLCIHCHAHIDAIHKINARNPKLRKLIKGAKESIIEYFESHSEEILGRIDSYMKAKDYKSAAYEAYAIPMVCKDLYNQASERIAYIPAEVLSGINPNAENIAKYTSKIEHSAGVLEHYQNILGLLGEEENYEKMGVLLDN